MEVFGKSLAITETLAIALKHLQHPTDTMLLWIDQISINQEDEAEKSEQVDIMGQIYRNAEEVLVWLGPAENNSDNFMDLFGKIGRWAKNWGMMDCYSKENIQELFAVAYNYNKDDKRTIEFQEYCDSVVSEFGQRTLAAWRAWYQREWFTRVWVVQEYALGSTVILVCGDKRIDSDEMFLARQIFDLCLCGKILDQIVSTRVKRLEGKRHEMNNEIRLIQAEAQSKFDMRKNEVEEFCKNADNDTFREKEEELERFRADLESDIGPKINAKVEEFKAWAKLDQLETTEQQDPITLLANDNPLQVFHSLRKRRQNIKPEINSGDTLYQILQRIYLDNSMGAKDDRDRIYALLGLATDTETLGILADYSEANHTSIVYTRVAKQLICSGHVDLLILSESLQYIGECNKIIELIPSWVPDWTMSLRRPFAFHGQSMDTIPFFFPSGEDAQPEINDYGDDEVLSLNGFYVDGIIELGEIWDPEVDGSNSDKKNKRSHPTQINHEAYISLLEDVKAKCSNVFVKNQDLYESAKRQAEAVWRIPIGDIACTEDHKDIRATSSFEDTYKNAFIHMEFFARYSNLPRSEWKCPIETVIKFDDQALRYRMAMDKMEKKRLFVTSLGYVGMGPPNMEEGDGVVIFMGATVPFIVRSLWGEKHKLVGECYCDGIMGGEIVDKRPKQKFDLI